MKSTAKKVKKTKLSACLTCLLCNNFFRNATTISECLHTFCRECIDKKLIDEKLNHCPVCNVDLGCSPLDKLRTDHGLQDLRDKIFPIEVKTAKIEENVPSNTIQSKEKKDSPSSLKTNARKGKAAAKKVCTPQEPNVPEPAPEPEPKFEPKPEPAPEAKLEPAPAIEPEPVIVEDVKEDVQPCGIGILDEISTILSARRAKAAARRKFIRYELSPTTCKDEKKDDSETSKGRVQNFSKPESSQQIVYNNISGESADLWKEKANMCEPINCMVETTNKNKSHNNSNMQEKGITQVLVGSSDNDSHLSKVKVKKLCHQTEAAIDQNELTPSKSESFKVKIKRPDSTQEKPLKIIEDLNLPAQPVISSDNESNKKSGPIWFSLVASQEKEVGARLPQVSSRFVRVKDGSVPVSYIKKYIVKKLGLASESEVEIYFRGEAVLSSTQLQNLVTLWKQTKPRNEEFKTSIGSSAKDFVLALSYCRKA